MTTARPRRCNASSAQRPTRRGARSAARSGADRPQRHGLGACVPRRSRARRADQGRTATSARRPASIAIGRSFGFAASRRPGYLQHRRRHGLRRRSGLARLQHHHDARQGRARRCTARTCGACRTIGAACWSIIRPMPSARRLLHFHPRCGCRERPARPAASRCRSRRSSSLQDFAQDGAVLAVLPRAGARPLQRLSAGARALVDRALGVAMNRAKTPESRYRNARPRRHHAVAAGHEAGRRRQRHAAGVFERLARLEHRLLADHARALDLLQPARWRR